MRMHVKNTNNFCVSICLQIFQNLFCIMGCNLTLDKVCYREILEAFLLSYSYKLKQYIIIFHL